MTEVWETSKTTPSAEAEPVTLPRRFLIQAVVGLLMLPLSLLPFGLYFSKTDEGKLVWAKAETSVVPPRVSIPDPETIEWARANAPDYSGRVALLVYHGLGSGGDAERPELTIAPERFAEQLVTLEAAGMNAVTARDVALAFAGIQELPPNAFMVSFDDGRTDAMLYADPILEALEIQATMFVVGSAASSSGLYYVDWDGLRAYAETGRWDIQSHSTDAHHRQPVADGRELPRLTSLAPNESPDAYRKRIHDDLRDVSRTIEEKIGIPPVTFAYPFGAWGGDDRTNHRVVSESVAKSVKSSYLLAFHQDEQESWGLATCSDTPTGLRRLDVGDWSGRRLLARITSAADADVRAGCATSSRLGHTDALLEGAPSYVRERLERVAGDAPSPPDRTTVDPDTPPLWAATGDSITGCQATFVGCVGFPAPVEQAPSGPLTILGPLVAAGPSASSGTPTSPGTPANTFALTWPTPGQTGWDDRPSQDVTDLPRRPAADEPTGSGGGSTSSGGTPSSSAPSSGGTSSPSDNPPASDGTTSTGGSSGTDPGSSDEPSRTPPGHASGGPPGQSKDHPGKGKG